MLDKARSKATSDLDASVKEFHKLHYELVSHHEAEEHTSIDEYLAKVKMSHKSERWEAKLSVLKELIDHHLKEEVESLIPKGRKVLSSEEQQSLGEKFETEHKKRLEKLKG